MESHQSGRSGASFNRFRINKTDIHCGALSTRRKPYRNVQSKRWGEAIKLKVYTPQILFACSMVYSSRFYFRFDIANARCTENRFRAFNQLIVRWTFKAEMLSFFGLNNGNIESTAIAKDGRSAVNCSENDQVELMKK